MKKPTNNGFNLLFVRCSPVQAELLESLKITLYEALELNKQEAIAAAKGNYQEEKIAV